MSKKNPKKSAAAAANAVAAAYRSSLALSGGGNYANSPTLRAIRAKEQAALGALVLDGLGGVVMGPPRKKPRPKLTAAEKAARGRVLAAHRARAARAARLPGGKKPKKPKAKTKTAPKRTATAASAVKSAARRAGKRVPTVTAAQAVARAQTAALKRWVCEGARRSGCGAGGSRVITATGKFKRLRPPRFMR